MKKNTVTKTNRNRILITVPQLNRPGGVAALYNILKLNNQPQIDYFEVHGNIPGKILRPIDLLITYIKFCWKIRHYDVVHSNPSLTTKSFYRDAVFLRLARLFNKKAVVYWHGWDDAFESKIKKSWWAGNIFKFTYAKANLSIVLGNVFYKKLQELGQHSKVVVESNAASDAFITKKLCAKDIRDHKVVQLLFLARVEKEKGIYVAIDAVQQLANLFPVQLTVAGEGSELENVRQYLADHHITNVNILGKIAGAEKHQVLSQADMLVFPTWHKEGMPIVVIEGMMYGLPVITRPVGGVPDWLANHQNGLLVSGTDYHDFADAIASLVNDSSLYHTMSKNNLLKANKLFTPGAVTQRMMKYYAELN